MGKYKRNYLSQAWLNIKGRCYYPNHPSYKWYGARGIKIYDDWYQSAEPFRDWIIENLGHKPTPKHSLDRIDNNGNYEPGNLRWATQSEQCRNKRYAKPAPRKPNLYFYFNGRMYTTGNCQEAGLTKHQVYNIKQGKTKNTIGLQFLG